MQLQKFLEGKPLFYKEIDYTRMPRAFRSIKGALKPFKIIHVIGTNGKGSTGRFLAQILRSTGASVGHYTSPHIFKFNERFWLNGCVASDEILEAAHERLQNLLSDEFKIKTSYFEYATLLAAVLFEGCDYFVCEAGMGGEFDATNVYDKILSLFTPIGLDHMAMLGDTIERISLTKFNAMSDTNILNDTMNETSLKVALDIARTRRAKLNFASEILNLDEKNEILDYAQRFDLPDFLISNLTLAAAAARQLGVKFDMKNLGALDLGGRCERVARNLYADVGHNELGAQAIARNFKGKKLTLIYNSFLDKDFRAVLSALKPVVSSVLVYDYKSEERELGGEHIKKALTQLNLPYRDFARSDMTEILAARNGKTYLAFGSFYLVEAFLRDYYASKGL
ncbi:folylpolyglutamate synthase/dihydrofolate synthase family protein [Campylobacter curvus]|uniref:Mur ligase family protein n=1 Tax=Campylobacter curvus TaxID=200 RepID=UPI0003705D02|nr:Mur ligase family protein [Campylobacter curvus]QKF61511.1 bifunctional folypolyglutamate synthetase / dihydrofolate synthetase [Campylobacter curvus]UEB49815.1 bifunctional folylpolyglutamate synthase/dihydrofolate synthase [Campylobacter curvus]